MIKTRIAPWRARIACTAASTPWDIGRSRSSRDGWRRCSRIGPACGAQPSLGGAALGSRAASRIAPEVTCPRVEEGPSTGSSPTAASLPEDEVVRVRGIPVTSVPRTMFDLAGMLEEREVERAWNEMEVREYTRPALGAGSAGALSGAQGVAAARPPGASRKTLPVGITRNDFEEAFLALIDRHGLPRPRMNAHVALRGRFYEIDCFWEDQRVAIELDGGAAHSTEQGLRQGPRTRPHPHRRGLHHHPHHLGSPPPTPRPKSPHDLRQILTPYPSPNGPGALRPLPPR